MAIIADRSAGLSCSAVAEKYQVDKGTVSRICSRFREQVPEAEMSVDLANWKEQLKTEAVKAVHEALRCEIDAYKRGGIGLQTLRGLGEMAGETAFQVNHFSIDNVPADWQNRYRSSVISTDDLMQDSHLIGPAPGDDK
jgi:hypothetical protein